ncbi:uncharacterized protein N7483_002682 [Penicillium malachiteum]|uniref:uncharacterized protein n=1 Tax=Penicillium malachiteum TaxID=1324776 RepID=UPI0025473124|nr:uncharacterized protein N7483_002682 [Penicillium malachiteum]KAJ5737557.1 hypothetical protein N7483_002682 [Penicillium malachiteum]
MRPAVILPFIFAAVAVAAPAPTQASSEAIQSADETIDKEWSSVFDDMNIDNKNCRPAYYPCILD